MIIVWNGLGFLVAVITFACLILTEYATRAVFHDDGYYQAHGSPKLAAFLLAALVVWPLGRGLNSREGRVLPDPATGKHVFYKPRHALFFIPMEYWGPVLVVLGVVFLFVKN